MIGLPTPSDSLRKFSQAVLLGGLACALGLSLLASGPAWAQEDSLAELATNNASSPAANVWTQQAETVEREALSEKLSKSISVQVEDVVLEEALRKIAEKGDVELVYGSHSVLSDRTLTLRLDDISVRTALSRAVDGTKLEPMLSSSGHLVLTKQSDVTVPQMEQEGGTDFSMQSPNLERAPLTLQSSRVQQGTITGTVTDSLSGEPIPGANVAIAETQQGAATASDGTYEITGVEAGTYTLVASFVGYADETRGGVTVQANQTTTVDFALQSEARTLEEMVVVGYGEQQREDVTGSISKIQSEELEGRAVSNVEEALQGLSSGVQVIQNSGAPGGNTTVRIRGTNSINAGSDPLYVIDGFPGGDINSVSPNNIESIEVLKDASATAIYGARGAGGVVMITTKSGAEGQESRVNFNYSYGWQQPSKRIDLLSAEELATIANKANEAAGRAPEYSNPESFGEGTDWQDKIFRTAPRQDFGISVSGGSNDIQYFISGNYLSEEGIVIESFYNRAQLRANLSGDVTDRLRVGSRLNLSRVDKNQAGASDVRNALLHRPTMDVRNENGKYNQMFIPNIATENPVAGRVEPEVDNHDSNVLGNVFAEYTILDKLNIRSSFSGNYKSLANKEYTPTTLKVGNQFGGRGSVLNQESYEFTSENTVRYNDTFNKRHDIEILGGYTYQQEELSLIQTSTEEYPIGSLGFNRLSIGTNLNVPETDIGESILRSFLFRTNYGLDGKYLFTVTGRYDGSSKFGEGNKYGFFPSGAIGWRISEEKFFQKIDFVNRLKLRISYGVTGNQEIGDYAALARLSPGIAVFGNDNYTTVQPTKFSNPSLKWEETTQLDVGIDAGLFNDRLSITADYYRKQTKDLLLEVAIPDQTGFSSSLENIGAVENEGIELSLNLTTTLGPVSWDNRLNLTRNNNAVTDLGDNMQIFPGTGVGAATSAIIDFQTIIVREGEPLGSFNGFIQDGVYRTQDELQNGPEPNKELGDPKFIDTNNDGEISEADKQIIGNGQPDLYGGFSSSLDYKGLSLNFQINASIGNDVLNTTRIELESVTGATNDMATVTDHWSEENPDSDIPRAVATGHSFDITSRYVEDGSYLRLQRARLSFDISRLGLSNNIRDARLYIMGTNLLTLTGYTGYDPEVNFQGGSNVAYSIDFKPYPKARTVSIGVNLVL